MGRTMFPSTDAMQLKRSVGYNHPGVMHCANASGTHYQTWKACNMSPPPTAMDAVRFVQATNDAAHEHAAWQPPRGERMVRSAQQAHSTHSTTCQNDCMSGTQQSCAPSATEPEQCTRAGALQPKVKRSSCIIAELQQVMKRGRRASVSTAQQQPACVVVADDAVSESGVFAVDDYGMDDYGRSQEHEHEHEHEYEHENKGVQEPVFKLYRDQDDRDELVRQLLNVQEEDEDVMIERALLRPHPNDDDGGQQANR